MSKSYKLMRESMLELDIREFEYTRIFNDYNLYTEGELIESKQREALIYPEKRLLLEVYLRDWRNNQVRIKLRVPQRVIQLDEMLFFENGPETEILIEIQKDGSLLFNTNGIFSRKLFLEPFKFNFLPSKLLNFTYLSKRKNYQSRSRFTYQDELGFAHLYWHKREMEQKKYFEAKENLEEKILPSYRSRIVRKDFNSLDFTMRPTVD
ncbi:hypothetical protein M902_2342 [Bacteriovorax sp. BAL6_X]|uniref:hypothetical protein n=1 Tax=Bacteriovorax sp. BAL6_X TaxID=1201290 RepID=UPI00038554D4|nr:hypothetical protein [Bacteriovorax sp. BAL6_X]EPZ52164.1 hypothetical protein M902_2342 [Bacteriovorax sp. BAL6_X]